MTYLPALLVLLLACTTVGTLIYARTAIREGEIALRSALGATRARIIGQLFVEGLVLASAVIPAPKDKTHVMQVKTFKPVT